MVKPVYDSSNELFPPPGLAIMFADWYLQNKWKLYHSNLMRLVTGIAGGYAMGLIIWTIVALLIKFIFRS